MRADLRGANLRQANLQGAHLSHAKLRSANLSFANLSDAHLSLANLTGTKLIGTLLNRALLRGTDLRGALLKEADLSEADLSGAITQGTLFVGPSEISISTIYRSQGNIPETFLKGAGVSDTFIDYIRSLIGKPIEYYTCFISHSSKDKEFAERLYNDLQAKGVRCWFAPEDMKTGDVIRTRIDEAIRVHDKLRLVLSQHSIESSCVEKEVETAFEKERQQKRHVLFPVRLDDVVMQTSTSWAADIRRMRHITDFTNWKGSGGVYHTCEWPRQYHNVFAVRSVNRVAQTNIAHR